MKLLEEIRGISREAARLLEHVDCCEDQDIRSLTQNELQELLPGLSNFILRKKIYKTIHKKRPIHAVLNELKSFIPDDFLRDAFSNNGVLQDYLQMLKTLKSEVNHVQEFLDAHIDLLEKFNQREDTNPDKNKAFRPSVNNVASVSSNATKNSGFEHNFGSQKTQGIASPVTSPYEHYYYMARETQPKRQGTVTYKVSVSGNTLNSHMDILEKLKSNKSDSLRLQEAKHNEDSQVTIVFCPVVSRAGTDVEKALSDIPVEEPVILVIMHHSHSVHATPTGQVPHHNVVLIVNIFFHQTSPGLLKCSQNDEAINQIQAKLKSFSAKSAKLFHQSYHP